MGALSVGKSNFHFKKCVMIQDFNQLKYNVALNLI